MIYLYSGTPGSGKSLHTAQVILGHLFRGVPVICNFEINKEVVKRGYENFTFIETYSLSPQWLMDYSKAYFGTHKL